MKNTDLRKYNKGSLGNKGGGRPSKNDEIKLEKNIFLTGSLLSQ